MTPEALSTLILAGTGFVIQLALKNLKGFKDWYADQKYKGLWALLFDFAFGAVYFGLGCVPVIAEALKLELACSMAGFSVLLQAFGTILLSQQLTFMVTKKSA